MMVGFRNICIDSIHSTYMNRFQNSFIPAMCRSLVRYILHLIVFGFNLVFSIRVRFMNISIKVYNIVTYVSQAIQLLAAI